MMFENSHVLRPLLPIHKDLPTLDPAPALPSLRMLDSELEPIITKNGWHLIPLLTCEELIAAFRAHPTLSLIHS